MQKPQPLTVLYRIKNNKDSIFPNAFITIPEQYPPRVKQIKQAFPWGQLKQQSNQWILRFGLSMNNSLNCDVWLDLKDQQNVPMIADHQIFIQLQQKYA